MGAAIVDVTYSYAQAEIEAFCAIPSQGWSCSYEVMVGLGAQSRSAAVHALSYQPTPGPRIPPHSSFATVPTMRTSPSCHINLCMTNDMRSSSYQCSVYSLPSAVQMVVS
jgi:hypothetical protein